MTYKQLLNLLEQDGWYQIRQKGSHRQFRHKTKKGLVTIAHHGLTQEVGPKMLSSILRQAQIEKDGR